MTEAPNDANRVYANPGIMTRMTLSTVAMIAVALYGLWELWAAGQADSAASSTGFLFGIVFVGGAAYGFRQITGEARDLVVSFDIDRSTGNGVVRLWSLLGPVQIVSPLDRFANWRFHVKIGPRNAHSYFLYADHPDRSAPLQFDLQPKAKITDEFRRLAPQAFAEFEERVQRPPLPS